ncbi:exodeoxyribonuclease I subunit D [Humitalea rosea]|uniref:Nuclease SbcCD subunit D n=1 Tax=Humitalea rosea TaxID=990373 RepID=A0A2W7I7Z6_9PROT|nr:exonuclease SbcCD subunit D [Humitalea rosea]PZW43061.1 exodeoxyribonuclease I subunit D [Humitalea rosea]
MRFLHTADWHLGRTLGGAPFLPEQEWLLCGAFLDMVRDTRPDAVIIAGDIFDRSVPPTDAVRLLDDLLARIIRGQGVPVVLIPGNHDDPARLSFAASLLRPAGLHIADSALGVPFPLADAHGEVWIAPSGYASPPLLAQLLAPVLGDPVLGDPALGDPALPDHDQGFAVLCRMLQAQIPEGARRVMVAHGFVAGGEESGSERALAVGGARPVSATRFAGFDYVALGHLHRAQSMAEGRIAYSGSPLAYSFAEAGQPKSVALVEMDATGGITSQALPLIPRSRLRVLNGPLETLLAERDPATAGDWLRVVLTDPGAVWEPMARLREAFPNLLELAFARHAALDAPPGPATPAAPAVDALELLRAFHLATGRGPLPEAALPIARAAIEAAEAAEA